MSGPSCDMTLTAFHSFTESCINSLSKASLRLVLQKLHAQGRCPGWRPQVFQKQSEYIRNGREPHWEPRWVWRIKEEEGCS